MSAPSASMPPRRSLIFSWGMSSLFGWGVYGLNLALSLERDVELQPVCARPIEPSHLRLDPLRARCLQPMLARSVGLQARLAAHAKGAVHLAAPVLHGLGNGLYRTPAAHDTRLGGRPDIGVLFFEDTALDAETLARGRGFAGLVCGSSWNRDVLRAAGLAPVETVLQGVDTTLFHPAPRLGLFPDRFLIFSGGKLEHRKGQDLVLQAFKAFHARHPDALLVIAWHTLWPRTAASLGGEGRLAPVPLDAQGLPNGKAWLLANGVPEHAVLDLGAVPNADMPPILREMDVGLFPNRCEGGTNLVAMECMACAVPVILAANTGHRDLIEAETGNPPPAAGPFSPASATISADRPDACNCFPLWHQAAVPHSPQGFRGTEGWGESGLEEILERLEQVYTDRDRARQRGQAGAATLARLSWPGQIQALKRCIAPWIGLDSAIASASASAPASASASIPSVLPGPVVPESVP